MKKLEINYLFIDILTLLLAAALWPSIPWFGKTEGHIVAIQSRGELRASTLDSPLTRATLNDKKFGLDYELAQEFADYLGMRLKVTVRQNIDQLFDDLDNGNTDLLAAGLVCSSERVKDYQPGPTYYSVLRQLVYRAGQYRSCMLATVNENQLTIVPGHVVANDLQQLKKKKLPDLSWKTDDKKGITELLDGVIAGKLGYTIADSIAISLYQRVHPELAVALDVPDKQPVIQFSRLDDDNTLPVALLDFFNIMSEDGSLARLEEKYLGHGDDFDYVDTHSLLRTVDSMLPDLKPLFEKYTQEVDWRLLAVTSYQEPRWDAQATSLTGARGLMMLTKNTAQDLGLTGRTSTEQNISGGARYLQDMMSKISDTIPEGERIWFVLAVCNMGYTHMLDVRALTVKTKGNPNSWSDVKQQLPLPSQKPYYDKLTYGYACGHEAYAYAESTREYQISLVGYLQGKGEQALETQQLAQDYPAMTSVEPIGKDELPLSAFLSQMSSNYLLHSPFLLFSPQKREGKQS